MALTGVLRPGYVQIRVMEMEPALRHYRDLVGLNVVSTESDGRVYLKTFDEFDRHSIILREADEPGMDFMGCFLFFPSIKKTGSIKSLGLKLFSSISLRDQSFFRLLLSLKLGYFPVIILKYILKMRQM